MESRNLQLELIDLVADERGLSPEKVRLSDRLLQDLGMDGDDAVDFFNNVNERFGTDLTHLHERWHEHFGAEGFSIWNGLVIVPTVVIGVLIARVADLSAFWSVLWGFTIAVALLAAWLLLMRRCRPADREVPITVGDVLAAVRIGRWPTSINANIVLGAKREGDTKT